MEPMNGAPIAYTPRDERIVVDYNGTIIHRADARPQYPDTRQG
jgi:sulfur carrier protein ThiS